MAHEPERIPAPLLFGAAALAVCSVAGVAIARLADVGLQKERERIVIDSMTVLFNDEQDGGVGVYDYRTGAAIKIFAPETGGFVRTAMRAVAHQRKVQGGGPEAPFELARTREGRLLLSDPLTGETVSLEAFGSENAGDFAQLFTAAGGRS